MPLTGERLAFLSNNAKYIYELELEREKTIIAQTERLLLSESLLISAFYTVLPLILDNFGTSELLSKIIWGFTVIISFIILSGLCINIFAQWRYKYVSMPNHEDLKSIVADLEEEITLEEIEGEYYEKYVSKMCVSLEKINTKRSFLLKIAMITWIVALGFTGLLIIVLMILR